MENQNMHRFLLSLALTSCLITSPLLASDKPFGEDIQHGQLSGGVSLRAPTTSHVDRHATSETKKKKHSSRHHSRKKDSAPSKIKLKEEKDELSDEQTLLGETIHGAAYIIGGTIKFIMHGVGIVFRKKTQEPPTILHADNPDIPTMIPTNPHAEHIVASGLPIFQDVFKATTQGVESFATILTLFEEISERTRPGGADQNEHLTRVLKDFQAALGKKTFKTAADQAQLLGMTRKIKASQATSSRMDSEVMERGLILDTVQDIGSGIVNAADYAMNIVEDGIDFVSAILNNRLAAFRENLSNGTTNKRVDTFFDTVEGAINMTAKISPFVSSALVVYPPAAAAFNVLTTGISMYGSVLSNQEVAVENVIEMLKKRLQATQTTDVFSSTSIDPSLMESTILSDA